MTRVRDMALFDDDEALRLRIRREWYAAVERGDADEFIEGLRHWQRNARRARLRGRFLRARLWALHILGRED